MRAGRQCARARIPAFRSVLAQYMEFAAEIGQASSCGMNYLRLMRQLRRQWAARRREVWICKRNEQSLDLFGFRVRLCPSVLSRNSAASLTSVITQNRPMIGMFGTLKPTDTLRRHEQC